MYVQDLKALHQQQQMFWPDFWHTWALMKMIRGNMKMIQHLFVIASGIYSHVHMRRLKASLVDVVEGEGLSGVSAIFIHLHQHPVALQGL